MIVNVSLKLICKEKMQKIHNFRIMKTSGFVYKSYDFSALL